MNAELEQAMATADAAAGALSQFAGYKRKADDLSEGPDVTADEHDEKGSKSMTRGTMTKAREVRLEQNRKAARESRRRKKVMIEELQRSVIFFSRANNTLKQQNEELTRLFMQAQSHISASEDNEKAAPQEEVAPANEQQTVSDADANAANAEQQEAQVLAAQAAFESKGFSSQVARACAQTMAGNSATGHLPPMQPGATMQAMANFQQAAAAAMQAAMGQMQTIPGVNVNQLLSTPVGSNAQQAFTDTMTALAMQQAAAAAAAAGQQFGGMQPGAMNFMHPFGWQPQQAPAQQQQPQQQTGTSAVEQESQNSEI